MRKKEKKENKGLVYLIILILCIILSIVIYFIVNNNKKDNNVDNTSQDDDVVESSIKPFDYTRSMKVVLNDKEYEMVLENNLAALDLLSVSPIEMEMEDLNNNKKYYYLSYSLADSDVYYGTITKGDVMLYQSNCVVLFYEDVDTSDTYIKLGHINDLDELDNGLVNVIFKE